MNVPELDIYEVPSASEQMVAGWLRSSGRTVVNSNGRWWTQIAPGFYQPVCLLNTSSEDQPDFGQFALGWRAALHRTQSQLANGSIPIYLRDDINTFSIKSLSSKCRNSVRKGLANCRFERITNPSILWTQGYEVYSSFLSRTQHGRMLPLKKYRKNIETLFEDWHIVIGGFADGKLGGYIDGYTVDGTGYGDYFIVASEVRSLGLGNALLYHMMSSFSHSGRTFRMMNGLQSPEVSKLDFFKRSFGFEVVDVPAVVRVAWPVKLILKTVSPSKAFRFLGRRTD